MQRKNALGKVWNLARLAHLGKVQLASVGKGLAMRNGLYKDDFGKSIFSLHRVYRPTILSLPPAYLMTLPELAAILPASRRHEEEQLKGSAQLPLNAEDSDSFQVPSASRGI